VSALLSKVIPIGQGMLRRALHEYVAHHHLERNCALRHPADQRLVGHRRHSVGGRHRLSPRINL
jgi:hypothetical protein